MITTTNVLRSSLVALAIASAGCGAGQDKEVSTAQVSLAGHWVSASCESSPGAGGSTNYFTRDFTLTATEWTLAFTLFGDAACTQKTATVDIGAYRIAGDAARVPGAREAEFSFGRRTVLPEAKAFADFLSGTKCGTSPWKVGEKQDLLAGGCAELGEYPVARCASDNDVVKVDGDKLWFGQRPSDNDMCTPAKRPQALGAAPVTRR
jgi:adenomatous polyposis coli down-regulated (APCDD)-like protein